MTVTLEELVEPLLERVPDLSFEFVEEERAFGVGGALCHLGQSSGFEEPAGSLALEEVT